MELPTFNPDLATKLDQIERVRRFVVAQTYDGEAASVPTEVEAQPKPELTPTDLFRVDL